MTLTTKNTFYD